MRNLVIQKIIFMRNRLIVHNFKETGLLVMMDHEINERKLNDLDDETLLEILEDFIIGLEECDYVTETEGVGRAG